MTFSFSTDARIEKRWDGSKFVEGDLTLSGADGISISVDSSQFLISGSLAEAKSYADSGDASTLSSAQSYTDSEISSLSGYVDSQDSATLSSAQSYADSAVSTYSGFAEDQFVNESGDTMTGFLSLHADPTASGHAANKAYVDAAVASGVAASTIEVKDDDAQILAGASSLDFGHAISVSGNGTEAEIEVDESEFTSVVFLTGNQTIGGEKTFSDNSTFNGDVQIDGNLTVTGTTTTLNTEELLVEDNIIVLNSTVTGTPTLDAGIAIERGTSADAQLLWDESLDRWVAGISGAFNADDDVIVLRSELETLSGYVDSQDAATLSSAQSYTDSEISSLSGYVDSQDAATLSSAQSYTDSEISSLSGYVDSQDAATLSSAQSYADSAVSTYSGFAEDQFVNESGDTMTGFLSLHADPTASGHAANKAYVDAAVSSGINAANIEVEDDGASVGTGIQVLDFGTGLDATLSGSTEVLISVNESELTGLMHLAGEETATGKKTFSAGLAVASGVAPANSGDTQSGVEGELRWDDDFFYLYTGSSWKRTAIASF